MLSSEGLPLSNHMGQWDDVIDPYIHSFIHLFSRICYKSSNQGLPWWLSGKESACQCRTHGFELWLGKIPHITEQLSLWGTVIVPVLSSPEAATGDPTCCSHWSPSTLELVIQNKRSHCNEKSPLTTLEKSLHRKEGCTQPKVNK